jgi:GMP synthase-like glutamine amidotransferase
MAKQATLRILSIVHQPDAGPGVFAAALTAPSIRLEVWHPAIGAPPPADPGDYAAVVTFGGGMHADQEESHPWLAQEKRLLGRAIELDVPVLGVCLGAQLLAEATGASVRRSSVPEIGWSEVETTEHAHTDPLLAPLAPRFRALEWHSYEFPLPRGAVPLARSATCLQAYRVGDHAWGIQFHAEVTAEIFDFWLDHYDEDPDALGVGIDPHELRAQTRPAMAAWNRLGRGICDRFLEVAARCRVQPSRVGENSVEKEAIDAQGRQDRP